MSEKSHEQRCPVCVRQSLIIDALTRERDEAVRVQKEQAAAFLAMQATSEAAWRAELAEAVRERDELRAALEAIAVSVIEDDAYPQYAAAGAHAECVYIARAALDSLTTDKAAQETKDGEG